MSTSLRTTPEPVVDVAHGAGLRYDVGERQELHLEVYPDASVARLRSVDAQVSLYRQSPPTFDERGVVFERHFANHHLTMVVMPEGHAILAVGTKDYRRPADAPPAPPSRQDNTQVPEPNETAVFDDPRASQGHPDVPVQSAEKRPQEKQPRLTLHGRVGASPSFRTRPSGMLVAQFPLGVHTDDDTTTWHTIVAFDERAEKLKGSLKKGQPVEVIGYVHTKEQRLKDGTTKQVEEIYATVIRQR